MTEDEEQGILLEKLTLERVLVPACRPPYWGGFITNDPDYWERDLYHSRIRGDHCDIIYLNTDGKKHRIYGPAYISILYNFEIWYKDGLVHRHGGPALTHKTDFIWMKEGKFHNLSGPAILSGGSCPRFYIDGRKYSPKEYKREI